MHTSCDTTLNDQSFDIIISTSRAGNPLKLDDSTFGSLPVSVIEDSWLIPPEIDWLLGCPNWRFPLIRQQSTDSCCNRSGWKFYCSFPIGQLLIGSAFTRLCLLPLSWRTLLVCFLIPFRCCKLRWQKHLFCDPFIFCSDDFLCCSQIVQCVEFLCSYHISMSIPPLVCVLQYHRFDLSQTLWVGLGCWYPI